MGLSQEVRFKISGDTKSLKSEFQSIPGAAKSAGERAGDAFERAFKAKTGRTIAEAKQITAMRKGIASADNNRGGGGGPGGPGDDRPQTAQAASNVAKYAFRIVGGAIAYALRAAIEWNRSRVQVSDAQGAGNAEGLASLRSRFAAVGGLRGQHEQGRAAIKDLELQKQFEENRRDMLAGGLHKGAEAALHGVVSFVAPEELTKSETAIARINAEIQKQHDANALIERDYNRQLRHYQAEKYAIEATNDLRKKGMANTAELARVEQFRLFMIERAESKFGTPESAREAALAYSKGSGVSTLADQQMRQQLRDVRQDLAGQAAEGRTFANGRARPLSETERLARRAIQFRERARQGILTGATGDAGRFIDSAIGTEATVANRLGRASAGVKGKDVADATSIKPEIVRSNQLLEAIKNSLATVDVD